MAWWWTPAIVGGLMLYAKSKASAAFRWILSDEASVKSMPVALLLTKISSGEVLPAAPQGFRWKAVELNFASSPFSSPQTLVIDVLDPFMGAANGAAPAAQTPGVTGASGFLTSQSLVETSKSVDGFLSKQEFDRANGGMGQMIDRAKYLYAPQTAPDFGGFATEEELRRSPHHPPHRGGIGALLFRSARGSDVLGKLGAELRAKGLVLAPVGPKAISTGDYVVTTDGALYVAVGPGRYRQLSPATRWPYVGPLKSPLQSAYGVRKAAPVMMPRPAPFVAQGTAVPGPGWLPPASIVTPAAPVARGPKWQVSFFNPSSGKAFAMTWGSQAEAQVAADASRKAGMARVVVTQV